jgi:hypothetical protein
VPGSTTLKPLIVTSVVVTPVNVKAFAFPFASAVGLTIASAFREAFGMRGSAEFGEIALFGPNKVMLLLILTFSAYVPAQTLMVSPLVAAFTAAWIVVCVPPVAQTSRVAADADVATTTLLMVRVEAIRESASNLRAILN